MTLKQSVEDRATSPAPLVNLPQLLPIAIQEYLNYLRNKNLYLILESRYGVNRKRPLTLDEISRLIGVTRERVRQLQNIAIAKLRHGFLTIPLLEITVDLNLLHEIKALYELIKQQGTFVDEDRVFELITRRYSANLTKSEKAHVRILLTVYGFKMIEIPDCRDIWETGESIYSKAELAKLSGELAGILHREVKSVSYIDLLLLLKLPEKQKRPTEDIIRFLLAAHTEIEQLEGDYYQIKFSKLRGAQKLTYRILSESRDETPLHSDVIAREVNHRLVSEGKKAINKGTIVNAMTHEEHLVTIGKSGLWGLEEWDLVQATIVELMLNCFHKLKKPASTSEIFDCVKKSRNDVKRSSIAAYLPDRPEFVQVGWGLYQPRDWKITDELKEKRKLIRELWTKQRYAQTIIEIFDERGVEEMPLKELAEELAARSGRSQESITGNVLSETPAIRIEGIRKSRTKKAFLVRDYEFPKRTRMLDKVHNEVRRVLSRKPNNSMQLGELKEAVMQATGCRDKTFYQYLQKMPDIRKQEDASGSKSVTLIGQNPFASTNETDRSYDVAISYAGQDIDYARQLASLLREAELSVFFAPHEQVMLSGEFLPDKLLPIYRNHARKCVILSSQHYHRSRYTDFERKAALDRKLDEEDYVILVKLDDTNLKGWLKSDMYYDARRIPISSIAQIVVNSLNKN